MNHTITLQRKATQCMGAVQTMSLGEQCPASCVEYALASSSDNPCTRAELREMAANPIPGMPSFDLDAALATIREQDTTLRNAVEEVCQTGCLAETAPTVVALATACLPLTDGLRRDERAGNAGSCGSLKS